MKIETGYAVELDTKGLADDGTLEGYASPFGSPDLGRDIVMAGAFAKSLAARPASRVKMLRSHEQAEPIGVWTAMAEDSQGLHVKGRIIRETRRGAETIVLMREGALDGLSIGFKTKRAEFDRKSGHRALHEIDLYEISVVTWPMHPDARVALKAENDPERARSIVAALERATAALRS